MAQKRPMTAKEIRETMNREAGGDDEIRVMNVSKQLIRIHLHAPENVDFYVGATDVELKPGQQHTFKKRRLQPGQVERLCKQGLLQITYDSE